MSWLGFRTRSASSTLYSGVEALERATQISRGRITPAVTEAGSALLARAKGRRIQDMSHTVVVFAGATGSGKSSLFNAVVGADLARVAPTRPTTSEALAVTDGGDGALLDWLGITQRRIAPNAGVLAGGGVILVDLPDIDSTESANRAVAENLIARADVVIWVVDPQKYADGVLHGEFLQAMREHAGGMIVALNQIDRLNGAEKAMVPAHLRSILDEGGLSSEVLVTSAVTGEGVEGLRARIQTLAKSKQAAAKRLAADLRTQGKAFHEAVVSDGGILEPPLAPPEFSQVAQALNGALGAPVVVRAAEASYIHRGVRTTGWLWTKWVRSFRTDPLKRLHLGVGRGRPRTEMPRTEMEGSAALGVPAITGAALDVPAIAGAALDVPAITGAATSIVVAPALESAARGAIRRYSEDAAANLPRQWRDQVVAQSEGSAGQLVDVADNLFAGLGEELARRPKWWSGALALQWICALAAVVGLGWLAAYWVADWFKMRLPEPPYWGPIAVPTVLVAGGLLLGWLLAALARLLLKAGARRLSNSAARTLADGITQIAEIGIIDPLEENLGQYGDFVTDVSALTSVR